MVRKLLFVFSTLAVSSCAERGPCTGDPSIDAPISYRIVNYDAEQLGQLGSCEEVSGDLVIHDNPRLRSLEGLSSLRAVSGLLRVTANPNLLSVDGLRGLTRVGGELIVEANDSLPMCEAEALAVRITADGGVGGPISIENNDDTPCDG